MTFNLATILRESTQLHPDKPVVLFDGGAMTYAELDVRSDRFAAGLRREGIAAGDAVAVQLPNIPEFLVAYFGILKAGSIIVPMNPLLKAPEIAYQLADAEARALIVWARVADEAAKAAADVGLDRLYVVRAPGIADDHVGTAFDSLLSGEEPTTPRCTPPSRATPRRSSTRRERPVSPRARS